MSKNDGRFKKGNKEWQKVPSNTPGRGAKPKYMQKAFRDLLTSIDNGEYTMADKVIQNINAMLHETVTVERLVLEKDGEKFRVVPTIDEHASDNARIVTLRCVDGLFGKAPETMKHQFDDDGDGLHTPEERLSAKQAVDRMLKPKGKRE